MRAKSLGLGERDCRRPEIGERGCVVSRDPGRALEEIINRKARGKARAA